MNAAGNTITEKQENVIAGIVGAFLFSLAGAVVWVLLDLIGFYAGISGLVAAVCAIKGYQIFGGKLSKKGVIIAAVIALLVLVLAWYGCMAKDYYNAYKEWFANGEVDYMPTYFEVFGVTYMLLGEAEIAGSYILGLFIGLVFAVLGSFRFIKNTFKSVDQPAQPACPVYDQNGQPIQPAYSQETAPAGNPYNEISTYSQEQSDKI